MRSMRRSRHEQPWKFTIAEDLKGDGWLTRTSERGRGSVRSGTLSSSAWCVAQSWVRLTSTETCTPWQRRSRRSSGTLLLNVSFAAESHDEDANGKAHVPEEIAPGGVESWYPKKRSTLGAGLVMTAPGVPMIFQGQEMLEDRWFQKDPVDWPRLLEHHGILQMYTDMFKLRRNWQNNTAGLTGAERRSAPHQRSR